MIGSLVTLAAVFIVLGGAGLAWRGGRRARSCPSCGTPLRVVSPAGAGPNATYDVLDCPTCDTTRALVQGALRAPAFCPVCRNRSLEVLTVRAPADDSGVEVHEGCSLCRHERVFAVALPSEDPRPLGRILPFPTRAPQEPRRRDADGAS